MFDFWRRRKIDKLVAGEPLRDDWARLVEPMPILAGHDPPGMAGALPAGSLVFADKEFGAPDDLEVSADMALVIAAQAALPILALDIDSYHDWKGVIVYPDAFITAKRGGTSSDWYTKTNRSWSDRRGATGRCCCRGRTAPSHRCCGWNVVIHECAHKLDMQTGAANGCPALPQRNETGGMGEAFRRGL